MAEDTKFVNKKELLTFEEIVRIAKILANEGVNKIRITGGEPFVRKDIISLLENLKQVDGIEKLFITTNGINTLSHVKALQELGISGINLSLDTLNALKFEQITKRNQFSLVWKTLQSLVEFKIPTKLNVVVMNEVNSNEILDFVELTKNLPISIRFIEEMPFNGQGQMSSGAYFNEKRILETIFTRHNLTKLEDEPFSTSFNYKIDEYMGTIGIIPAYTRSFCGSCNRLRINALGQIKTCLYGHNVLDIKNMIRSGHRDEVILNAIKTAIEGKYKNGVEAEKNHTKKFLASMSTIGG